MARKTKATSNADLLKGFLSEQIEAIARTPTATDATAAAVNARAITCIIKALEALQTLENQEDTNMQEDEREHHERLRAALELRLAALFSPDEAKAFLGDSDDTGNDPVAGGLDSVGTNRTKGAKGT